MCHSHHLVHDDLQEFDEADPGADADILRFLAIQETGISDSLKK